jgi:cell wall-associated NlpC family hydrolase
LLLKKVGILILVLLLTGCSTIRRGPLPPVIQKQKQVIQKPIKKGNVDLVCDLAHSFIGTKYVWGGTTPAGFDCSGLTQFCYKGIGIKIPRKAVAQSLYGDKITKGRLRKGDLVFFKIDSNAITHVGIYIGDSEFIHAPGIGKKIKISSLENQWWETRLSHARRII